MTSSSIQWHCATHHDIIAAYKVVKRSRHDWLCWMCKQYLMVRFFSVWSVAAKKPTDAAPKPKKPPAPKAKKPDKSIWDSDSDTGSKKPSPALKGTAQILCFPTEKGLNRSQSHCWGGIFRSPFCSGVQVKAGGGRGRALALKKITIQWRKWQNLPAEWVSACVH